MSPAQEQFARVMRYLARMELMGGTDEDTDDMYSFFLHAWHLMDWTINDPTVGPIPHDIKTKLFADITPSIRRCGDIANARKHVVLTQPTPRPSPKVIHMNTKIIPGSGDPSKSSFTFSFPDDGSTKDALTLARQVATDWEHLLKGYGLSL